MNTTGSRSGAYFGSRTHDYEASGFLLAESAYRRSEALPMHSHDNAHFCLVLSGSYTEQLESGEAERRPGDLIFYPAGVDHAERHHSRGRHFMIDLGAAVASRLQSADDQEPWTSDHGATRAAATRVFAEFRRARRIGTTTMRDLVDDLVATAVARELDRPRRPDWLGDVESRLREIAEGSPDLEELARQAGVHPVYLGRAFRKAYGCTPGHYLRRLRVLRAQRALAAADAEIADVAYAAGFCDQSHLNRVFKRQTGVTPGRYRKLVQPRLAD
jgi:AraC family transcriptional regulator